MSIYAIVSCLQAQRVIICVYIENCIFINVILFYFVFSVVFIGEGQNLTISFTFFALYMLVCVNKF